MMSKFAHKRIALLAVDMANEVFEEALSTNNDLYRGIRQTHPDKSLEWCRKRYVKTLAPSLVPAARATLAKMLALPGDPKLKQEIYDALMADAALSAGRNRKARRAMN